MYELNNGFRAASADELDRIEGGRAGVNVVGVIAVFAGALIKALDVIVQTAAMLNPAKPDPWA